MVLNVANKSGKALIYEMDIKYKREHSYIYGVPLEYQLGTSFEVPELEVKKDYILTFNNQAPSEFRLHSVKKETVAEHDFFIMRFVKKVISDILINSMPNNTEIFSVKLDKYIMNKNNQLNYILFELRKKSLCLINNDELKPTQKHINELLASPQTTKDSSIVIARALEDYQLRFQNYYTITDTREIVTTENGKNLHNFLPFERKESIFGLDNYLIPSHELTTNLTTLKIGDTLELEDEKIVIIEKDELVFFGTVTTYMVGAKASIKL